MKLVLLFVLLVNPTGSAAKTVDFSTPVATLQALEMAYIDQDFESVVASNDFPYEAREMLRRPKIKGVIEPDEELVREASKLLNCRFVVFC